MIKRFASGILDRQEWADDVGEFLQKIYLAVLRPVPLLKDFLHGTWLGHPLHPVITDVPVGALTVALFLDIVDQREGAKWATLAGLVSMGGAAVTGVADYTGADGKARRYGTIHSLLMFFSLVLYLFSVLIRFEVIPYSGGGAVGTAVIGYLLLALGAYVGGEIVYSLGYMVDRHAWRSGGSRWTTLDQTEFPDNAPVKAKAGQQTLVVVRKGEALYALHDTCAHAGCSLAENGALVGDKIECQCHGSRYDLATGRVARGPATYDQPAFELRRGDGRIEARRR
jgi:nitrite reductase/ring-hydroxylating ferredoxin subunit/uncharacterized membrane protein